MGDFKIGFDEFIAKAYEVNAAMQSSGEVRSLGLSGNRLVTVPGEASVPPADAKAIKSKFVEAVVAKFGEGCRRSLREAVYGDGKDEKPLPARLILDVNKMFQGSTAAMAVLKGIMNRAATIGAETRVGKGEVDKMFSRFDKGDPRAKAFFEWQDTLGALAKDADDALNELLEVDPGQLGTVFDKYSPDEEMRTKLKAAVDAQFALAEKLNEFDRKTGGRVDGVDVLYTRASAKGAEIMRLATELSIMKARDRTGLDLKNMFARQALEMHGNADVVEMVEEKVAPLLARVAAAKVNAMENGAAACPDSATVLAELESAKQIMAEAAKGFSFSAPGKAAEENSESVWKVDSDFLAGVVKALDEAAADLKSVNDRSAKDVIRSFVNSVLPWSKSLDPVRKAATDWVNDPSAKRLSELKKQCQKVGDEMRQLGEKYFVRGLSERLESMRRIFEEGKIPAGCQTANMLNLLLERRLDAKAVVLARAYGATDEMIDTDISDANLVSRDSIGQGGVSTVHLCQYKGMDGKVKQYVFKPELTADIGFGSFNVAFSGYGKFESVMHLNAAAKKVAEALGTPGVVTGVKVGCLKGVFGMFMEVADGTSIGDMAKQDSLIARGKMSAKSKKDWGVLDKSKVCNLEGPEYYTLAKNFMRATLDLEWNDWLTGQSDRHKGNYFIAAAGDLNVSVKGIDNDLAFPSWRLGLTRFKISGLHLPLFTNQLRLRANYAGSGTVADLRRRFKDNPALEFNDGNNSVTVDPSKSPGGGKALWWALHETLGLHSMSRPVAISEKMYSKLMDLDKNRDEFRKSLSPHVGDEGLDAMLMRLDEMVAYAKTLHAGGRVMDEKAWQNEDIVSDLVQEQVPKKLRNKGSEELANNYFRLGLLQRDFLSYYKKEKSS